MIRMFTRIGLVVLLSGLLLGQSTEKPLEFEAADVRVSPSSSLASTLGGALRGGRYAMQDATMVDLVQTAYGVDPDRVVGGPSWMGTNHFDVVAKVPAGTTSANAKIMLQSLLADRFKLTIHKDSKPVPAYVLTVGKGGPKMKPASGTGDGCQGQPPAGPPQPNVILPIVVSCHNMTMSDFADQVHQMAGGYLDHTVVDSTKLEGAWDFDIKWTGRGQLVAAGADGISIFDAVDKQLGLKLEQQTVSLPVIYVVKLNSPWDTPGCGGAERSADGGPQTVAGHSLAAEGVFMGNDLNRNEDSVHPPRWAQALLCAVLKPEVAEAESGDLLEAYRDSLYPSHGRRRADLWYLYQVAGYVVRSNPAHWSPGLTSALWILVFELIIGVPLVVVGGGLILLATLLGSILILLLVPILWLSGDEGRAGKTAAAWIVYLALYIAVSTGVAFFHQRNEKPIAIGQEFCADAGCFGVDKADRGITSDSEVVYTLSWHLASRDTKAARRFPGKGLELFMFDKQGREFSLLSGAYQDPLNVLLPPGETVRQSIAFRVPTDAKELFLSGRYRPFTFQSLLPGNLSLLPHTNAKRIRIR